MTPLETSNASGHVLNMGMIGLSGTLAGMPLEALVLGAVAGALHHGLRRLWAGWIDKWGGRRR